MALATIFCRFDVGALKRVQNVTPLLIPASIARIIEREGESAYPVECCGILFGRNVNESGVESRVVERIEPVVNEFEAPEQRHRFLISGERMRLAEETADRDGRAILGMYHSHPHAPARPSEFDREHAWPYYSYVIVAIAAGAAQEMTSWVLNEATHRFERQDILEIS